MSHLMYPIPFAELMRWAGAEYKKDGRVFGVNKIYRKEDDKLLPIFGETLETPFGPAAGPNTQLAQNIIASYMAGARFFELKTVQIMDGAEMVKCIARPCIKAEDECYNCEWSTELYVHEALDEYIKAWFALKLFSREWGLGSPDGFVFNMSVGYDLAGIKSEKVDTFIEGLKDATKTAIWKECMDYALGNVAKFHAWDEDSIRAISPKVCRSVTLSTLHGCPPDEIERIATYLISEKKLNTFVKCNPTLLGYEFARKTMDGMGYDYLVFDDHHFKEDLQFEDAVPMFHRLGALAEENGLSFGVKLTNTFPVTVGQNELPSEEMYMSGKSLFPLTTALAAKLTKEFGGKLRISFSGGADAFNIEELFRCGIWPITVATTILKPGGYNRFKQFAEKLSRCEFEPFRKVDYKKIAAVHEKSLTDPNHVKALKPLPSRKLDKKVPLFNCFTAPCKGGCPIHQDIPEYVELVGKGKNREALRVIIDKNPLPFITGTICSHRCMNKCTRNFYDTPVRIREAKLAAARNAFDMVIGEIETPAKTSSHRVAIVGGGPAGISAAYFLGRAGVPVTLYEKRDSLGGIVKHVIPKFRIKDYAIDQDVLLMERMGVKVKLNTEAPSVEELKAKGYDFVLLAAGAWAPGKVGIEGGEMNVLEFLEKFKKDRDSLDLGKNVVVIGGGNTAMDAARAAKRVPGVEKVSLVYRRTKKYMPADEEELLLALEDGVEFCELLAPVSVKDGVLSCKKMTLGAPDESGRRRPVETDEVVLVPADTVIAAVGEKIESALFEKNGVALNERGRVACDPVTGETNVPGVYVAGDAKRGPATVVEAIADAAAFAKVVAGEPAPISLSENAKVLDEEARAKKGILKMPKSASCENGRCLDCNLLCECCVDVCPNRANISIKVPGHDSREIIHIDRMCNECGNCEVFCPYDSRPYRDKFTLYHTETDFADSENSGFLLLDRAKNKVRVRLDGEVMDVCLSDDETALPAEVETVIWTILKDYDYLIG